MTSRGIRDHDGDLWRISVILQMFTNSISRLCGETSHRAATGLSSSHNLMKISLKLLLTVHSRDSWPWSSLLAAAGLAV